MPKRKVQNTLKQPNRVTFDTSSDVIEKLDEIAGRLGVNRSVVVRWAIRDYIFLHGSTSERTIPGNVPTLEPTLQPA